MIGLLGFVRLYLSMNHPYCRSHKKTPYELMVVSLVEVEELFNEVIYDEVVDVKEFENFN